MGSYTERLTKRKPKPFGRGTAAMRQAVLDGTMHTTVEDMVRSYGGPAAMHDFAEWLNSNPGALDSWRCHAEGADSDVLVAFDPSKMVIMARETPLDKELPFTHPVKQFVPDPSLTMIIPFMQQVET